MSRLAALCLIILANPLWAAPPVARPNILWLTSEDHGPQMGCYGDSFATTPNVDALAARGMLYTRVWSCAPVCAPARTTIISGLYPPATGAEHMRSMMPYPKNKKMFPQLLREAGYYCTNCSKEDYNLAKPGQVWDMSSPRGHWRNRQSNQPFFAVFNSMKSHESQIRKRPHVAIHDPARVRIPAYHPDTPEVRRDWAQYYDMVTAADADAGKRLKELEDDGLSEDTIIFYFADHGPGMPRCKRSACDSGLHVPMVVYIPEKFRHLASPEYRPGGKSDRLISFVDLAPTILVLAGIQPPAWLHGHAFLGRDAIRQPFIYGFRGRMDEKPDLVRSVTDGRYVYIRNYMPHKLPGQYLDYMFQTPTTRVWKQLHDAGRLTPAQDAFWKEKPAEELYDLQSDPDEVKNLATSPAYQKPLAQLRDAQQKLAAKIRDVGFLPEGELRGRFSGVSPLDLSNQDEIYPFQKIFDTAERAARRDAADLPALQRDLTDHDPAVRYWAAMGFLIRGASAIAPARESLFHALEDHSRHVRAIAAEGLLRYGTPSDQKKALDTLVELASWERHDVFVVMESLNALAGAGDHTRAVADVIAKLPKKGPLPDARYSPFVPQLIHDLVAEFK